MSKGPNMCSSVNFSAQKCIVKALKRCIKRSIILSKNNDSLNLNWTSKNTLLGHL